MSLKTFSAKAFRAKTFAAESLAGTPEAISGGLRTFAPKAFASHNFRANTLAGPPEVESEPEIVEVRVGGLTVGGGGGSSRPQGTPPGNEARMRYKMPASRDAKDLEDILLLLSAAVYCEEW